MCEVKNVIEDLLLVLWTGRDGNEMGNGVDFASLRRPLYTSLQRHSISSVLSPKADGFL